MRVIGTLTNENDARRFSNYLKAQEVGNTCEPSLDLSTDQMSYQIWIHDEDRLEEATLALEEFKKNPADSKFDAPIPEEPPVFVPEEEELDLEDRPPPHRFKTRFTNLMIALCAFLFFLNSVQEVPLRIEGLSENFFIMTPLQSTLMYDLPPAFEELEKAIENYQLTNESIKEVPLEIKSKVEAALKSPYWRGIYDWVVNKLKGNDIALNEESLFFRIRQGEIWRLISPVVLHSDILHILFNMLWLWFLGRPIEQRIGPFRLLFLSLLIGIGSNTVQYFMSGPFFIGYSGIVTGLAGFIWMRERVASWEGYPLNRATILFLLIFIGAIFLLQLVAFALQLFTSYNFAPNIANSAHIAGALIGAFLGRFHFFAQRVHK